MYASSACYRQEIYSTDDLEDQPMGQQTEEESVSTVCLQLCSRVLKDRLLFILLGPRRPPDYRRARFLNIQPGS